MNKDARTLEDNKKRQSRTVIVHLLVMTFGVSAWIGINGIFIQLPLLVNTLPEGWGLAAYLTIAVQAANVGPVVYSLLRRFFLKTNESRCILGMLVVGCFVMGLMSFLYDRTSIVVGSEHSTAMFVLTFFTAILGCTSSVLFMPYLKHFKEIYLVSYFVGEGLSGVLPSIVALIQGISENPMCNNATDVSSVPVISSARFSPRYYFLFICACLLLSLLAFLLLENLSYIKQERITSYRLSDNNFTNDEVQRCYCQKYLLTSSEGLTTECEVLKRHVCLDESQKTDTESLSKKSHSRADINQLTVSNLYLLILLGVICLLANGLLPGLQPYSCLAYGNVTYHLSATLSQIANPTACFLALWYLPRSRKLMNFLSCAIFAASGYVALLATSSSEPPLRGTNVGKALVVLTWVLLVALISYVKLMITSVFRKKSEKSLFLVGLAMQAGSACGAILSIILINFTNLLKEYKECSG